MTIDKSPEMAAGDISGSIIFCQERGLWVARGRHAAGATSVADNVCAVMRNEVGVP